VRFRHLPIGGSHAQCALELRTSHDQLPVQDGAGLPDNYVLLSTQPGAPQRGELCWPIALALRRNAAAVRAIEDCIGISSSIGKAPIIPKHCADRAALLEACIESHQAIADEKTNRCSGPQPIPKQASSPPQ
jgi:hypothetical protein